MNTEWEIKNPMHIVHRAGYSVELQGRNDLIYAENGNTFRVQVEDGGDARGYFLTVYASTLVSIQVRDGVLRTESSTEKSRILGNVRCALTRLGIRFEII